MKENNLKNSPLARLYKNLAVKKMWDLNRLAEEMREIAVEAQQAASQPQPLRAGADYVKAMLHGGKRMPHRWQVRYKKTGQTNWPAI